MDESAAKAFEHFWGRVGSAEQAVFNWTAPRLPPLVVDDLDDSWFEDYKAISEFLKPQARRRSFIAPPEVPGDAIFQAETAHEALMFILNPPKALFGLPHLLATREYLDIKREAQQEFRRARGEELPGAATVEEQPAPRPRWDSERRILWYGENICKKYRQQADNQIAIIEEFEKQGWPPRINDPLGTGPANVTRQQTSDAVRALNKNKYIAFQLGGDRKGVLWEPR
jgi:hypothetical protein